jgi:hypothetical protein
MTDKTIEGLSLADYKSIELEASEQLNNAHKILLISRLMLENCKKRIKELGGKTMEEQDEEHRRMTVKNGSV